jgi:Asp-tRNA(Asn)/Glu-tRNA(Gln) amidotransferase A subunit family amidase
MPDTILMTDPARLGIAEAAALIARRVLSPVTLTRAVLDRIAARDGALLRDKEAADGQVEALDAPAHAPFHVLKKDTGANP